eukprot:6489022-Amphidinium_carterae.1
MVRSSASFHWTLSSCHCHVAATICRRVGSPRGCVSGLQDVRKGVFAHEEKSCSAFLLGRLWELYPATLGPLSAHRLQ